MLTELRDAGATSIGIHVESLDDDVRRRWMPGKSTVSMAEYEAAWAEAVRVFGRNRVSTYLLIGLGEDPDSLVEGAGRLIDMGVYPFAVPMRPMPARWPGGTGPPRRRRAGRRRHEPDRGAAAGGRDDRGGPGRGLCRVRRVRSAQRGGRLTWITTSSRCWVTSAVSRPARRSTSSPPTTVD